MVNSMKKLGQNQESIQAANKALLLELLRSEGECSRADLAKMSGLQPTTVTYIVNDFIECGVVEETGLKTGTRGRRSISLKITDKKYAVLGIRITRKGFSAGIFTLNGNPVKTAAFNYPERSSAEELVEYISKSANKMISQVKEYEIIRAGIAVPGPYNINESKIMLMTGSVDWSTINLKATFAEKLNVGATVIHDASAGALSLYWTSKKIQRSDTLLYVSVGQGVGGGILMEQEILNGSRGYAGEMGHMTIDRNGIPCECGNKGCLEKYSSSMALVNAVNEELGTSLSFREISELIRKEDETALKHFDNACEALAIGTVSMVNCLDPDKIIFGDEMAKIKPDRFLDNIRKGVTRQSLPTIHGNLDLMVADSAVDAELSGAGMAAIRHIYRDFASYFESSSDKGESL